MRRNGFAGERLSYALKVEISDELMAMIPQSKRDALTESTFAGPAPGIHIRSRIRRSALNTRDLTCALR